MRAATLALLAAAAAAPAAGCDECEFGTVICQGNEVWSCLGSDAPLTWNRRSCGDRSCHVVSSAEGVPEGVCSVEPAPNPACEMTSGRSVACAGGRVVACHRGFVIDVVETCAAPELCVTTPLPFCAVSLQPDARCPATGSAVADLELTSLCAGGHLLRCAYPSRLLAADIDCGGEELCYRNNRLRALAARAVQASLASLRRAAVRRGGVT